MFLTNRILRGIVTNKNLEWYPKSSGAFIKFNIESFSLKTLFFVHRDIKFRHIVLGFNLEDQHFNFPAGVNMESGVLDFLMDKKDPKAVEISFGNRKRFLRNMACQKDLLKAFEAIDNPNSIYHHLESYLKNYGSKPNSFNVNYFLIHYYLRLAAKKYCTMNNIPLSTPMTN